MSLLRWSTLPSSLSTQVGYLFSSRFVLAVLPQFRAGVVRYCVRKTIRSAVRPVSLSWVSSHPLPGLPWASTYVARSFFFHRHLVKGVLTSFCPTALGPGSHSRRQRHRCACGSSCLARYAARRGCQAAADPEVGSAAGKRCRAEKDRVRNDLSCKDGVDPIQYSRKPFRAYHFEYACTQPLKSLACSPLLL